MRLAHREEATRETDPTLGHSPERRLWCAVVGRALEDATGHVSTISDAGTRDRVIEEARSWFQQNGRDFRLACDAAGYDPDVLRQRVLGLIAGSSRIPLQPRLASLPVEKEKGNV